MDSAPSSSSAPSSTRRRVLRALLASGVIALGWVAIDLVAHAEPAAAAETIDLVPLVGDTVDAVTTPVENVVTPVVTTVTAPIEPIVSAVAAEVISPVVTEVVTPVVEPILEVAEPIVAPIVTPIITPIVTPITDVVDGIVPVSMPLGSVIASEQFAAGGALIVGSLLAASTVPLLAGPTNGAPRNAPTEPTGSGGSLLFSIVGDLTSGLQAAWHALRAGPVLGDALPSSPTFAFDTTPD